MNKTKITMSDKKLELDAKRLYLPGKLETTCPHCGAKMEQDFEEHYLSYPKVNDRNKVYLNCDECDEDSHVVVGLTVKLEVIEEVTK